MQAAGGTRRQGGSMAYKPIIRWVDTPQTCKACKWYNKQVRACRLRRCAYPARR